MAASDAKLFAVKGIAYRVSFSLYSSGTIKTGATSLDSEISKDFGTFSDCTNEATEIGSTGVYYLDLTSTEMDADEVNIIVKSSNADTMHIAITTTESDIETNIFTLLTRLSSTRATYLDELNGLSSSISTLATNINTLLTRLSYTRAGYLDELNTIPANIAAIDTDVNNLLTNLATVNGIVDTINTNVTTVNNNVITVDTVVDTINSKVDIVDTNVDTLLTNVSTINGNVNDTETKVDTLTTNLATANGNINDIETKVDTLTTNLSVTNSNVNDIETKVDSLTTNLSTANTNINTANTGISTLTTRIDVTLSTRAATGAAMTLTSGERDAINTVLTTAHGSGSWTTGSGGGGGTDVNVISLTQDALDQIEGALSGNTITVTSPVSSLTNEITIYRGDSYLITNGRQIQFTVTNATGYSSSCTLYIDLGHKVLSFDGTVTVSGSNSIIKFELTTSETISLTRGKYNYRVEVLYNNTTNAINIVSGIINILSQFG